MSTRTCDRQLTANELKCLRMLETWELLVDDRKLFGVIGLTDSQLDYCHRLPVARPLGVTTDRQTNTHQVRFDLSELHKYIEFICDHFNVTENIDGTITTHDGMTVPIKFKQPVLKIAKVSK